MPYPSAGEGRGTWLARILASANRWTWPGTLTDFLGGSVPNCRVYAVDETHTTNMHRAQPIIRVNFALRHFLMDHSRILLLDHVMIVVLFWNH
jgi:hypothetical protein